MLDSEKIRIQALAKVKMISALKELEAAYKLYETVGRGDVANPKEDVGTIMYELAVEHSPSVWIIEELM
jgi:hypothetical protein